MSSLTINSKRATAASITMPYYGAWSCDAVMADGEALATSVRGTTLAIGDLSLLATTVYQASFAGSTAARIVAGAGGWRGEIPAKGYAHAAGVKLSTVLNDAAREAGELIVVSPERTLGTHWVRERAKGERALRLLIGGAWWIDAAGVTQMTERDASRIVTPFTVVSRNGAQGSFEIATEYLSSWQPGRTFTAPTVPDVQTISSVTIEATNEGKLRLHVLTTTGALERLRSDMLAIVRSESPSLSYFGVYEYKVSASLLGIVSTIDCTSTDSKMPALTKVPLFGIGIVTPPLAGTTCRIRFVNGDPSRPECIAMGGTTERLMTIEATSLLIYNSLATLMAAAGGGPLTAIILQPLLAAAITAALGAQAVPAPPGLVAQIAAAAALQAGFAAGTTPSPAMFAAWTAAIAALSTKTLDVSGSFPSIGVPNG